MSQHTVGMHLFWFIKPNVQSIILPILINNYAKNPKLATTLHYISILSFQRERKKEESKILNHAPAMWGILRTFSVQLKESWFPSSLACSCFEDHVQHFWIECVFQVPFYAYWKKMQAERSEHICTLYLLAVPLLNILLHTIFSKSL